MIWSDQRLLGTIARPSPGSKALWVATWGKRRPVLRAAATPKGTTLREFLPCYQGRGDYLTPGWALAAVTPY